MVVLDGVVDNTEPGPYGGLAQRLPERPHEASPAQHRHVVEHAQGDQHRAAPGDGLPGPVRHAGFPDPPPARAGARAAATGRPELEGGLPRILATFPLHCGGHRRVLLNSEQSTPYYCICQQQDSILGQPSRQMKGAMFSQGAAFSAEVRMAHLPPDQGDSGRAFSTLHPRRRSPSSQKARWAKGGKRNSENEKGDVPFRHHAGRYPLRV